MSALRITPALLGAMAAAALGLWVGFAVVAGGSRTAPRPASHAQPPRARGVAPISLGLSPAPTLRVRPALFRLAPARAAAAPAPSTAVSRAPSPAPAPSTSSSAARAPAAEPARAVQPTTSPRPAPKPRPTPTAAPRQPSGPDFDESAPGGFDNSG